MSNREHSDSHIGGVALLTTEWCYHPAPNFSLDNFSNVTVTGSCPYLIGVIHAGTKPFLDEAWRD
jgi:hypothetical protein